MAARRRIRDATITHVSLCRGGRNRLPVIYKGNGARGLELAPICKAGESFDERGEILAVVYAPEHPDTDGDVADREAIRKCCHTFARSGLQVDIEHDGKVLPKDKAYVAESFIIQKGDPRFQGFKDDAGAAVDTEGAWGAIFKIEDPDLRRLYREGKWDGVSMFGHAEVEHLTKSDSPALERFIRLLEGVSPRPAQTDEDDMKPEELAKALNDNNAALATAVTAGVTEALKAAGVIKAAPAAGTPAAAKPKTDSEIASEVEFEGDFENADDVAAHAKKVQKAIAKAKCDFSNPKSVETYLKSIKKIDEDGEGTDGKEKSPDLKKALDEKAALERKIAKLQKAPGADGSKDDSAPAADRKTLKERILKAK